MFSAWTTIEPLLRIERAFYRTRSFLLVFVLLLSLHIQLITELQIFTQIISRLSQASALFGPDFPGQVQDHVGKAHDVNTFKTALEGFRDDASTASGKLKDLTAKKVDDETFKAGIDDASSLALALRDILAQYGKVVQGDASS
ncbi:hypothetical protein QCA50_004665 [Cerrena zonata]|uniref:Uncharacterized protein n=1 Tax=Cerrena zonata TaxID=2478898 RepID=A0AAW0GN01_9APHY